MSGISAGIGHYLVGIQTAKDVVATTFKKYRAAGPASLMPQKERARYSMTDDGRDQGGAYTTGIRVEGDVPMYLHPDGSAVLHYAVLGAVAHAGTNPNYTHTLTPADDLPWLTVCRMVGNVILEQYLNCKANSLRVESTAGGTPMATLNVVGLLPTFLAAMPSSTLASSDPFKHWEAKGLIQIGGAARAATDVSYEINNNAQWYQADDYLGSDIDPGKREVSFSFSMHFEGPIAEPKYREYLYGSDAGTTVSPDVATKVVDVIWRRNTNLETRVQFPQVTYSGVPVNMDPSGDPIEVEVACAVEKPTGATPITTVTVKDQIATF